MATKPLDGELVPQRKGVITIDGRLDETDWKAASYIGPLVGPLNPSGTVADDPAYHTYVSVLWDFEALYVAFICPAPSIYSTPDVDPKKLYSQDVVEMFLAPGPTNDSYAEVQVSPRGQSDGYLHHWRQPPTYPASQPDWAAMGRDHTVREHWLPPGFAAASAPLIQQGKTIGWCTEMKFPLGEVLRPHQQPLQGGTVLRANFIRYVYLPDPTKKQERHLHQLNWSPTLTGCPHATPMALRSLHLTQP